MITGLHHFSMIVSTEASVDFYKRLGFAEYKRIKRDYDTVVLMNGYGIGLEIFIDSSHSARPKPEPLGLRQLSLSVDDMAATIKELGLEGDSVFTDWTGTKFCLITDPDGNTVQLHE